jgi:hypothetical protein
MRSVRTVLHLFLHDEISEKHDEAGMETEKGEVCKAHD